MSENLELTILMPCLNERETITSCIEKAKRFIETSGVHAEVIVADNGSTDGSREAASALGAKVVSVERRGYGHALLGGIAAAAGRYIILGDSDGSYDFSAIGPMLAALRGGADLVVGDRFAGGFEPGATPALHRYFGVPLLSFLARTLFGSPVRDFHCGLRGVSRAALNRMNLRTGGMEFASEMIIAAALSGLKAVEVPVRLYRSGRTHPPHLRTWRDGWRHLRFLLLYSPLWVFVVPGVLSMVAGGAALAMVLFFGGPPPNGMVASILVVACFAILIGYQAVCFGTFTRVYAITERFIPHSERSRRVSKAISLESGLAIGAILTIVGAAVATLSMHHARKGLTPWLAAFRLLSVGMLLMALGGQTVFSSFFISMLGMSHRQTADDQ